MAPRQEPRSERAAPGFLGTAATWLMWVVAATVLIVLVAWGAQELLVYADDPVAGNDGDRAERDQRARVVARPLARAEELAADGRFGEAIRALLLRTLGELVRATPERLPPSLTSREILSSVALDDTARHLLGELVQAVEVSHFGGKDPGAAEYGRCLDVFRAFATTYVGGRVG